MPKLWAALKAKKKPPLYVNEKQYESFKRGKLPMKGYVGSVFAFGGRNNVWSLQRQILIKTENNGRR